MSWRQLEREADVPRFIDAAVALHRPLLDRIPPGQRPFFFDRWLRRFNDARVFLLEDAGAPAALVTMPHLGQTVHDYRWRTRTLACRRDLFGRLELPGAVGLDRSFHVPTPDGALPEPPIVAGTTQDPVQLGFVRRIDGDAAPGEPAEDDAWRIRPAGAGDLDPILELLERSYTEFGDTRESLARQREEVRQSVAYGAGWCFVATDGADDTPVGMASYVVLDVPLLGVPAVLVTDLAVTPACRGRGLARALQRHAWRRVRAAGIEWVWGNIDPPNVASRRQAEATGRTVWFQVVRFRPAESRPAGGTEALQCDADPQEEKGAPR